MQSPVPAYSLALITQLHVTVTCETLIVECMSIVLAVSNMLFRRWLWKCKRLRAIAHSMHATGAGPLSVLQALYRLVEVLLCDYLVNILLFVI